MVSKKAKYGIRSAIFIAQQSKKDRMVGVKEIAESIGSPMHFTAKILQELVKGNIVQSNKGPNGGFHMNEELRQNVNIKKIVQLIDGEDIYHKCGLGLDKCHDDNPCPIHHEFKILKNNLYQLHTSQTIGQLSETLNVNSVLK